uniref:F-box domain-containing protein n=1 Tax=Globodera rostochiensis TaxID=31243 RepID=A0A914HVK9_GLORO
MSQRLWLPPELVYELLSFVPSAFLGARHLLRTNAILYWLIIGGKYANKWRHPYLVGEREAHWANYRIGSIKRRPLCPRIHRNNFPIFCLNVWHYGRFRANDISDFQAILILDRSRFPPWFNMRRLRRELCSRINERSHEWTGVMLSCRPFHHPSLEYDTLRMTFACVRDELFHATACEPAGISGEQNDICKKVHQILEMAGKFSAIFSSFFLLACEIRNEQ